MVTRSVRTVGAGSRAFRLLAACGLVAGVGTLGLLAPSQATAQPADAAAPALTPGEVVQAQLILPGQPGTTPIALLPAPAGMDPAEFVKQLAGKKADASDSGDASELKKFDEVSKGFEKVISTADGAQSLYTLWVRNKDGQMLAELPRGWEGQKHFIAMTVASGEEYAGLQAGDMYAYWKRFDNRLMLIVPNLETRSTGDQESKSSVKRLFTDRVLLDLPILSMGPSGQPVIDMDDLLVDNIEKFFGSDGRGAGKNLARIETAKAFPQNVEVAWTMPTAGGILKTFHYSLSLLPENTGYQPRVADERVGYFTTVYRDLGKFTDEEKWIRYINRWHVEKADPKLKVSPPKNPIVFYIESTVPVRYRRFVREGAEYWNDAFRKVGIDNAVVIYQQDESTGAHMDKDPEDVRYNFIRWLSNDIGTAIGPSRVHPLTGQILDADVILTDGWIRYFWYNYNEVLPEMLMEGYSPETMAWLESRPQYDPRILLAAPEQRDQMIAMRARQGVTKYGGHPIAMLGGDRGEGNLMGTREYDGLLGRMSQVNGLCMAARGKGFDLAVMRMSMEMFDELASAEESSAPESIAADPESDKKDGEKKDDEKKKEEKKYDRLDGIPDWFVGPLLKDLVAHEVGHTIGLRHNFKASSIYSFEQINSPEWKDKPQTGSVMDYNPINMLVTKDGVTHGNYGQTAIGPYDLWVIEYGYTFGDPKDVVKRTSDPELVYGTDEDTWGPDPLIRRYDFAANPIAYAKARLEMAKYHRARLLDKFVKDGQSWAKARRGYNITLGMQVGAANLMANWVGTAHINRDRKGDPNGRDPIVVVPAEQQREALKFVIANVFRDDAFGLTPELLSKMTTDRWLDAGGYSEAMEDPTFPIHDRIVGIQASTLTTLINPTRLRRVYDNEFRTPSDKDAFTLPEMLETLTTEIFSDVGEAGSGKKYTPRQPMVSTLRQNLQREYVDRLIDLTLPGAGSGAAFKPISNLALLQLRQIESRVSKFVDEKGKPASDLDSYTGAHFADLRSRIDRALNAQFIYNQPEYGSAFGFSFFGQTPEGSK